MTFAFLAAAFLATRTRPGLVALAVGALAIAFAEELLDLLAISPESWRIAAGLVLVAAGLWALGRPVAPGRLPPDLLVLAIAAGADETTVVAFGALALGAVLALVAAPVPGSARLLAALEVAIGVALVVAGIRDV